MKANAGDGTAALDKAMDVLDAIGAAPHGLTQAELTGRLGMPRGSGEVSGLALDAGGGVWTALKDGWSVVRFAPDGSLDRVLGLPVPCPTDLAFGGAGGNTLYITSARHMVPMDTLASAPLSGRLLQVAV